MSSRLIGPSRAKPKVRAKVTAKARVGAQKKERPTRQGAMDRTREALLEAGLTLFGEQGLDAPSLDAICERAGFTRGAFYVHFEDRDAFIDAVMARVGLPLLDEVLGGAGDAASTPADLEETTGRFLRAVASGAYPLTRAHGPKPHQLLDACARSERVRARYVALIEDAVTRLSSIVRKSQATDMVRGDVGAEDLAWVALAAIVGAQTLLELGAMTDMLRPAQAFLTLVRPPTERSSPVSSVRLPTPTQLIAAYAEAHNALVRTHSKEKLAALVALFANDCTVEFLGIPFGPLRGMKDVTSAFWLHAPTQEIELIRVTPQRNDSVAAIYSSKGERASNDGTLELEANSGRIHRLVIAAAAPLPGPGR